MKTASTSIIAVFLLVIVLFVTGCEKSKTDTSQSTIALVNDEAITVADLIALMPEAGPEQPEGRGTASAEERVALSQAFLEQLIEQKMLLQEVARLKIIVTEKELEDRIAQYRAEMNEQAFLTLLTEQGLSLESLQESTRTALLIKKLLNRLPAESGEALSIPEDAVKAYYEQHHERWQIDVELKLRQIIVKTQEEAEALYLSILEGADFDEIAETHSKQSQPGEGGDLGYLQQGETPIEFDPLFQLAVGKISRVIKTPFGYHIVKVEDRRESRLLSYESVREKIYKVLLEQRRETAYAKWMSNLKDRTEVRINEELLKKHS